jgi:N-acetylneuraminic acid mutarotase
MLSGNNCRSCRRAQRRAGCHANGKIFVFGGERFGGVFNNAEMFDPETERWKELTRMPIGRHGTGAETLGNMIFCPRRGAAQWGEAQTN